MGDLTSISNHFLINSLRKRPRTNPSYIITNKILNFHTHRPLPTINPLSRTTLPNSHILTSQDINKRPFLNL